MKKDIEKFGKSNFWLTMVAIFVIGGGFAGGIYATVKANTYDKVKGAL